MFVDEQAATDDARSGYRSQDGPNPLPFPVVEYI